MSVGENIRAARLKAGLTQKQLGELSGIAEPTIRRYELGKLNPKLATMQRIADALSVPLLDITGVDLILSYREADTRRRKRDLIRKYSDFFEHFLSVYENLPPDEQEDFLRDLSQKVHDLRTQRTNKKQADEDKE